METIEEENLPLPPPDPEDQCDSNPEFAIICSFISNFGPYIDQELNIEELRNSIEDQETLHDSLVEIHVKLFKKLRRYFVRDQWEKAIIRYAYEYSYADGLEIDSVGYLKTRPSIKLRALRRLLDAQFECDAKFKAAVNLLEADKLNTKFAGRDNEGNIYWPCVDSFGNLRLYREEPLKYNSWMAICKNSDDLKQLIEHLDNTKDVRVKGEPQTEPYDPYPEIFPELFVRMETKKEKNETAVNKSNRKNTKRGKRKGRSCKKQRTLQTVDEADEMNDQLDTKPVLSSAPPRQQPPKPQEDRPRSMSPNESLESQVKHTLENIVNKVVSSFDFIFRRTSPEVNQQQKVECAEEQKPKPSRKRVTKREKPQIEELPRRSSSRIQQLQQKKIEEEATKKQTNSSKIESAVIDGSRESINPRVDDKSSRREKRYKKDKQRWRNKGKKKLSWDKDDSDLSSVSSLSESNDESFIEALNESVDHNDDDEFACEDEATNDEPVIIKRARTARQALNLDETEGLNNTTIIEEDKPCGRCDKSNDPDWILLCDMCDDGYHTTCCVPPMMYVPDGDWFCPLCEQKMLLKKLREVLEYVVEALATRERERQKKQKLRQPAVKKELLTKTDEILGAKRQRDILNELNEPLAVQALDEDLPSSPGEELPPSYREGCSRLPKKKTKKLKKRARQRYSSDEDESDYELDRRRKKKDSYIVSDSEFEEEFEEDEHEDEDFDDDELSDTSSEISNQLTTRKARAFVSYKFEEYDELIQSAICGDSDGDFKTRGEQNNPEPCNIGRGKDMATIEALAYQQENGLTGELNQVNQTKQRRRGRKLNDLDAESEIDIATSDESFQASSATEELDDDDEVTEVSSEEDSSMDEIVCMHKSRPRLKKGRIKRKRSNDDSEDSDFKPRSRRVAAKKVSYKESTDEEDEIVAIDTNPAPMTSNPINDLTEYCSQSSYPSNPLYSSFKMSPPHPQFYKEDEVRPLPDDE